MEPVTLEKHKNKSWCRFTSYDFASQKHVAALVRDEIIPAAHAMPLAFVPHAESFRLVAVMSTEPDINFCVGHDGRWLAGYIPSLFRSYPFSLARIESKGLPVLCVDESSGLIKSSAESAQPFFDSEGALSNSVKEVVRFLLKVEENRILTQQAVDALANAGVIVPWSAKVKLADGEKSLRGLFAIDKEKLATLSDDIFLSLRQNGALDIAWAQIFSQGTLTNLAHLSKLHQKTNRLQQDIVAQLKKDDLFRF